MEIQLIDSHAHLSFKDYREDEIPDILARAKNAGVVRIVNIGAGNGLEGNQAALTLAARYPDIISATVGVHPHDAASVQEGDFAPLKNWATQAVAIGEVGLDYFYEHSPRDTQRTLFKRFIELAKELGLPLIVHDRGAEDQSYQLLRDVGEGEVKGVIHCFTGSIALAEKYLELGFLLSFTGIITFKKADDVREVVRRTPLEMMMIETDSPFLAPVPYRGKRAEPAHVLEVAKKIAEIKEIDLNLVAKTTTATAIQFFGL